MKNLLGICRLSEESGKRMVRAGNMSLKNLIIYWTWGKLIIFAFQIAEEWKGQQPTRNNSQ